jgi:hypothetical protein
MNRKPATDVQNPSTGYYPFCMAFTRNSSFSEDESFAHENKYKYNSKEEQPMPGKWLDYGARFYDAPLPLELLSPPLARICNPCQTNSHAKTNHSRQSGLLHLPFYS